MPRVPSIAILIATASATAAQAARPIASGV